MSVLSWTTETPFASITRWDGKRWDEMNEEQRRAFADDLVGVLCLIGVRDWRIAASVTCYE